MLHIEAVAGAVENCFASYNRIFIILIDFDAVELIAPGIFVKHKLIINSVALIVEFQLPECLNRWWMYVTVKMVTLLLNLFVWFEQADILALFFPLIFNRTLISTLSSSTRLKPMLILSLPWKRWHGFMRTRSNQFPLAVSWNFILLLKFGVSSSRLILFSSQFMGCLNLKENF